jgi:hypothetical protein
LDVRQLCRSLFRFFYAAVDQRIEILAGRCDCGCMNYDWLFFFANIKSEQFGLDEAGKCQYVQNLLVSALNLLFEWRRHDV